MIYRRHKSGKPAALVVLSLLLLASPIIYTAWPMDRMVFAAIVTAVGLAAWGLARKEVQE